MAAKTRRERMPPMHFVEIGLLSSLASPLERGGFGPAAGATDTSVPGFCSDKKAGCSVCWRRRGPRDTAVDAGLSNEQGLSSDMMLADQWRADAITCVQPL